MSLTLVRGYFTNQCKAVGLTEWKDAFNNQNIPSTVIHKSFHIRSGEITGVKPVNNRDQELNCPVTITFFLKGFQNVVDAEQAGLALAEKLTVGILKNRLGTCVKNVILNSIVPEAFNDTNDNLVVVTMGLTAFTSINIYD